MSHFSSSLSTVLSFCIVLACFSIVDSKIHLYKQVAMSPKSSQETLSLCSEGKKLSHPDPDSSGKYFVCQYISKADMWLIHPMNCSKDQIFNSTTQNCQEIPSPPTTPPKIESRDLPPSHDHRSQDQELITKLSTALESMADTLKMMTNKFVKMIDRDQDKNNFTVTETSGSKTDVIINSSDSDSDGDESTTIHHKNPKIVPTMTIPSSAPPALESEDPGNNKVVVSAAATTSSNEYYSEELFPMKQKIVQVPITSSSGSFSHPQTTNTNHQQNNHRNPFFKFFLQNLLTPSAPPAPAPSRPSGGGFFMKHPAVTHSQPRPQIFSRLPVMRENPTTKSPLLSDTNTKGEFVNLFSVLNFLTGNPSSPSMAAIFNPSSTESAEDGDGVKMTTPALGSGHAHAHPNKIPVESDEPEEDTEIDIERKPVNSTTIHSNLNYSSEAQNSVSTLLSHSRKPRL